MAVCKVPADDKEALNSSLMGMFEKMRVVKLYNYVGEVDLNNPKTWKEHDLHKLTMQEVYDKFGIGENAIDFLGHAVALHFSDNYLYEPAYDTVAKM